LSPNIEEKRLCRLRWHQDWSGGQYPFEFVEGLLGLECPCEVLGLLQEAIQRQGLLS